MSESKSSGNNRNRSQGNRSSGGQNSSGESGGGGSRGGRSRRRRRGKKGGQKPGQAKEVAKTSQAKSEPEKSAKKTVKIKPFHHVTKKYGLIIFDTFEAAYRDIEKIETKIQDVDQLNVVIRAEGNMDDPKLTKIDKVKVFAGTAWALIHDRRVEDGWYDEPR